MSLLAELLVQGLEIQANSIAKSPSATSDNVIRVYEKTMVDNILENPYPISIEKPIGFMVYKKNEGRTCSTLMNITVTILQRGNM